MDNLTAVTVFPHEQIALLHSHEIIELKRYQWLTLIFLPFDLSISRLMSAISSESSCRLDELRDWAGEREFVTGVDVYSLDKLGLMPTQAQHFFVVNERMAFQVLIKAEEAAKTSHSFYMSLLESNMTPLAHGVFLDFAMQKYNEYHVLKECREQWSESLSRWRLAL